MKCRYIGGGIYGCDGKHYRKGDLVEMSAEQFAASKNLFQPAAPAPKAEPAAPAPKAKQKFGK